MKSYDDLGKSYREEEPRRLLENKACEEKKRSDEKKYAPTVEKCLGELGEYWFGSHSELFFTFKHYEVEKYSDYKYGWVRWVLYQKATEDYFRYLRLIVELKNRGAQDYFCVGIEDPKNEASTEGASENELRQLLITVAETWKKPGIDPRD